MTHVELSDELTDLFDNAIMNSYDLDWTSIDGALECAKALLADRKLLAALATHLGADA
jgi:hypothetical protein